MQIKKMAPKTMPRMHPVPQVLPFSLEELDCPFVSDMNPLPFEAIFDCLSGMYVYWKRKGSSRLCR